MPDISVFIQAIVNVGIFGALTMCSDYLFGRIISDYSILDSRKRMLRTLYLFLRRALTADDS